MKFSKSFVLSILFLMALLLATIPIYAEQDAEQDNVDAYSIVLFDSKDIITSDEHSEFIKDQISKGNEKATFALQVAEVKINEALSRGHKFDPGTGVRIDLFGGEIVYAKIDRMETDVNNMTAMTGNVEDSEFGFIINSARDGKVLTVIELPELNKQYQVVYDHELDKHIMYEFNLDEIDKLVEGPPLTIPEDEILGDPVTNGLALESDEIVASQEVATIDVMIVYTPNARSWANTNDTSINHVINQAMTRAQNVMYNSNTHINFNLVHSGEIAYTEAAGGNDSHTDLVRLTEGKDGFETAHAWRNQYAADLVALFSYCHDGGGLGWLLNTTSGRPDIGFSITRVQQASWTFTHVHEMGHNMGAHHHKEQNFQPGPGLFSYSAGWRWGNHETNRRCSVMTYESGDYFADGHDHQRVAFMSNPNVYNGPFAVGHPDHGNNARNLRSMRFVIEAYRDADLEPPPKVNLKIPWPNQNRPGTRVRFEWDPAARADSYQIQIRYASDNSFYRQQNLQNVTQVDLFSFPADETNFRWRVRAGNYAGYGPWSDYRGFRNSFEAFNTNIDNTRGYQGWVRRPVNQWGLNDNSMFTAGQPGRWNSAHYKYIYYSTDFDYRVTMRRTNSYYSAQYIVVRGGGRFDFTRNWHPSYYFGYANSGDYSIWRLNPDGSETRLQNWTSTSHIRSGNWNTLRVTVSGDTFNFYINGSLVRSITDSNIGQGMVGVTAYRAWDDSSMSRFFVANASLSRLSASDIAMGPVLIDPEQEALNEAVLDSDSTGSIRGLYID